MSKQSAGAAFRRAVLESIENDEIEFAPYDMTTLDLACSLLDDIEGLKRDVKERGHVVRGIRGGIFPNPALAEIRAAERTYLALVNALGLASIGAPESMSASAAGRALRGKRKS
ncbi:P27 family phage terminase small subunit [Streptomyces sp. CNZ748]|uniref:P27 family phage terminase small subunit n=1 Tax=Streptomyces sp. CNZ748 TaxID=2885160 RepID=UPI001E5BC9BE|nr:P27 family phage terminase small subunit [Streptomyces sp. CNZ748]